MDRIRIRGGRRLEGRIAIGGAKNAALPLMATGLLTQAPVILTNAPALADVATMGHLIAQHGLTVEHDRDSRRILLDGAATQFEAPYDLVRKMRASILVLGPLLARYGQARVSLPGGCAIGTRPVDLHLKGLEQMGAVIDLDSGYINATVPKGQNGGRLKGARILFPQVSVGATENLLMAATLAEGTTQLINAAREPEITDLANCLISMGARIEGVGSDRLTIHGVDSLHGTTHAILPDRIEAGTFACAGAITGGELLLEGMTLDLFGACTRSLREAGVEMIQEEDGVRTRRLNGLHGVDVMTEPFPGFATDMQAQFMALMAVAEGASMITETIFENRFMHVPELARMGARINAHGSSAIVRGVKRLSGAPVMATDLRASVSLIIAALAAEGETTVNRVYHLDRGYERIEEKLAGVGADIARLQG
ncbi:UDP-N-acetylglucosamine 1-carboxyvinyltransferase [Roseomonas sp. GC11]|uniref:UDP-N-acetylglucosamine 1-carboxyvinyltransferase n=1 Tax=Roseomonas sp. GC11 TaxID=2950546 RepID=UPI00210D31CD|nr:UDP-N-acetylglucosamine 1-carboxyvinyltransferase [Roseomonas sp. GC11]MCQ4159805.1 UDP-N-acetylglucosamine 1-carboxyvinyltransferase [Roseomonas sp. GC11]